MRMTKAWAGMIRKDAMKALQKVAEKHGLVINSGRGRFGEEHFSFGISFELKGTDDMPRGKYATAWKNRCHSFGLQRTWLGQTFMHAGMEYRIIGLRTRAQKRKVVLLDEIGNQVNASTSWVRAKMIGDRSMEQVSP